MKVKKENYIFVYIRVDVNKISVLAAGLNYSCSESHITVSKGDWKYYQSACILKNVICITNR